MFLILAALLAFTCTVAEGALKCTATNGMECVFPIKRPGLKRPGFKRPGFKRPGFKRPGFKQPGFKFIQSGSEGVCSGPLFASGPYGSKATPPPGFSFTDLNNIQGGNISKISFRTDWWMDQMQTTYGSNPSARHGGAGGSVKGPYILLQGRIIKMIEGFTYSAPPHYNPTRIASLRFTDNKGQKSIYFGPSTGQGLRYFAINKFQTSCYLRYFTGFTSGNDPTQPKGNYIDRLTFVWCC